MPTTNEERRFMARLSPSSAKGFLKLKGWLEHDTPILKDRLPADLRRRLAASDRWFAGTKARSRARMKAKKLDSVALGG